MARHSKLRECSNGGKARPAVCAVAVAVAAVFLSACGQGQGGHAPVSRDLPVRHASSDREPAATSAGRGPRPVRVRVRVRVKAGDIVTVLGSVSDSRTGTTARAVGEGDVGQVIRVESLDSRERFRALVIAERTVAAVPRVRRAQAAAGGGGIR